MIDGLSIAPVLALAAARNWRARGSERVGAMRAGGRHGKVGAMVGGAPSGGGARAHLRVVDLARVGDVHVVEHLLHLPRSARGRKGAAACAEAACILAEPRMGVARKRERV